MNGSKFVIYRGSICFERGQIFCRKYLVVLLNWRIHITFCVTLTFCNASCSDCVLCVLYPSSIVFLILFVCLQDLSPLLGRLTQRSCGCQCRRKWGNEGWYCCECGWADDGCFPPNARVTSASGKSKRLSELAPGDDIITSETIYY